MNSGFINGFSTNGSAYPQWVVRAAVVAVAAASVNVAPTRIAFASAFGDAAVSVTLTQTHVVAARAMGTSETSASCTPSVIFSARSNSLASSYGSGAVRRDVFATAGGDASSIGLALAADALGESLASAGSSVIQSDAHIIHPARSVVECDATAAASADVIRYPSVQASIGGVEYTRAEGSTKLNGESHYLHDGYVVGATAGAVATIPQDRIAIIATLGSFEFSEGTGGAGAFVVYSARALGVGEINALQVLGTHVHRPTALGDATSTGEAIDTRIVNPTASAVAGCSSFAVRALVNYRATASDVSGVTSDATGVRMAIGSASGVATADQPLLAVFGVQHYADAMAVGTADLTVTATHLHIAQAVGMLSEATLVTAVPTRQKPAAVDGAMASATVGRAVGFTNADVRAPDGRRMLVTPELRGMTVYFEDRTMRVTT